MPFSGRKPQRVCKLEFLGRFFGDVTAYVLSTESTAATYRMLECPP